MAGSFRFKDNFSQLNAELQEMKLLLDQGMMNIMAEVGKELKRDVLLYARTGTIYDLKVTGQFLGYLESEEPAPEKSGHVFRVGFGNRNVLDQMYRPAQSERVIFTYKGRRFNRVINFRRGRYPYWIVLEYGLTGSFVEGDETPPDIRRPKLTGQYYMQFLGLRIIDHKPAIIMRRRTQNTPSFYKPHPGIRPTRMFRRGLRSVINREVIERSLTVELGKIIGKYTKGAEKG